MLSKADLTGTLSWLTDKQHSNFINRYLRLMSHKVTPLNTERPIKWKSSWSDLDSLVRFETFWRRKVRVLIWRGLFWETLLCSVSSTATFPGSFPFRKKVYVIHHQYFVLTTACGSSPLSNVIIHMKWDKYEKKSISWSPVRALRKAKLWLVCLSAERHSFKKSRK